MVPERRSTGKRRGMSRWQGSVVGGDVAPTLAGGGFLSPELNFQTRWFSARGKRAASFVWVTGGGGGSGGKKKRVTKRIFGFHGNASSSGCFEPAELRNVNGREICLVHKSGGLVRP